ncbi:Uncharacterised protein [Raoultella ornithinolytica]|nr:Uncharacterised protein [Raoultella ornithinolytica]
MAVTVNQQRAARRCRIHADNFVRRRGAVRHHVALLGTKGAGDILLGFEMRAGVIEERPQLGDRNRHVGFQRIATEKVIKQAANRAFLVRASPHMPRRTEGIFSLLHIVEQGFGKRRGNVIQVFARVLGDSGGDLFCQAKRVFKEPQRHTQILAADIHRRMRVDEGV